MSIVEYWPGRKLITPHFQDWYLRLDRYAHRATFRTGLWIRIWNPASIQPFSPSIRSQAIQPHRFAGSQWGDNQYILGIAASHSNKRLSVWLRSRTRWRIISGCGWATGAPNYQAPPVGVSRCAEWGLFNLQTVWKRRAYPHNNNNTPKSLPLINATILQPLFDSDTNVAWDH